MYSANVPIVESGCGKRDFLGISPMACRTTEENLVFWRSGPWRSGVVALALAFRLATADYKVLRDKMKNI